MELNFHPLAWGEKIVISSIRFYPWSENIIKSNIYPFPWGENYSIEYSLLFMGGENIEFSDIYSVCVEYQTINICIIYYRPRYLSILFFKESCIIFFL